MSPIIDDPRMDATDAAHPAWWRGYDYGRTRPRINHEELVEMLRLECGVVGGQSRWANLHNLSPAYVSDVLNGRRDAGEGLLTALGLCRVVLYERTE